MNDRELLEAAAKAAGMKIHHWSTILPGPMMADPVTDDCGGYWNPLEEDAHALRLAVKLGLTIETAANGPGADAAAYLPGRPEVAAVEWVGFDPDNAHSAIRRAIVPAAASLTKESPQ